MHAAVGTPQEVMADLIGIDRKTLTKHFDFELRTGLAKANAQIGGKLFSLAMKGDREAAKFWLRTRAGWRERVDVGNPDGEAFQLEVKEKADAFLSGIARLASDSTEK